MFDLIFFIGAGVGDFQYIIDITNNTI